MTPPIIQEDKRKCTLCGGEAIWVSNAAIYGRKIGKSYMIWLCTNCKAYVGCHQNSDLPKGTFANAEIRKWRIKAHEAIDPLWQNTKRSRRWVYQQLSDAFGEEVHVGESDVERRKEIIATVHRLFPSKHLLLPPNYYHAN